MTSINNGGGTDTKPLYSKEDFKELMLQFEGMVRALNTKFNEDEIVKLVLMILQGHVQNGVFTDEYLNLSRHAIEMRKLANIEKPNEASSIILTGFNAR